jgi:hypothetical protein
MNLDGGDQRQRDDRCNDDLAIHACLLRASPWNGLLRSPEEDYVSCLTVGGVKPAFQEDGPRYKWESFA